MTLKHIKKIVIFIIIISLCIGGLLVFKNNKSISPEVDIKVETEIENKVQTYIEEKGKKYSKDVISGENSFYVGGIGKGLDSYDIESFKADDFDIIGLIDSVPDNCDTFGAEVIIDNEEIVVNIYTEKNKFYEKVE